MGFDFGISEKGELIFESNSSNILQKTNDELIKQIAINRIKSIKGDWFNTTVGTDIESFIGSENNGSTMKQIMTSIKNSLLDDGLIKEDELYMIPKIKDDVSGVKVFIKNNYKSYPIIIDVEIDIVGGVRINYDTNTQ